MIIGIIGSRRRDTKEDFLLVDHAFQRIYQPGDRICSGGCPRGGDRFAEIIAIQLARPAHYHLSDLLDIKKFSLIERHRLIKSLGAPFILYHADWVKRGKGAGFYRNTFIARDSDKLIACVADGRTGGAEDTIDKFTKKPSSKPEDLILV